MSPSTTVLASVFNGDGCCIGFVLQRGLMGYEAFGASEKSLGLFPTAKRAAGAILVAENGA